MSTRNYAPKAYENLENAIIDWFVQTEKLNGYENAVQAYIREYSKNDENFTRADAKEEITADSISALFSTKYGVKDFVNYVAKQYKQKATEIFDTFKEWINNIIKSINSMLKYDTLSPLQKSVLEMDKKQAISIRKEFLSALTEATKNYQSSKSEQKNNSEVGEIKFSKNNNYSVAKKKKSTYNEFNTLAMSWAFSNNTNIGDTKVFNRNGKEFVLIEATEDGYIELASGNYESVRNEYERAYNKANNSVYGNIKTIRIEQRRNIFNMQSSENRGYVNRNSGQNRRTISKSNPSTDNEHLRTDNKEISKQIKNHLMLTARVTSYQRNNRNTSRIAR